MKNPGHYARHTRGDGRRFHVRIFGKEWQVYGVGVEHIAMCATVENADMVANALEAVGDTFDRLSKPKE